LPYQHTAVFFYHALLAHGGRLLGNEIHPENPSCSTNATWDKALKRALFQTKPEALQLPQKVLIWDEIQNFSAEYLI
jgi:hypothetical protein